MGNEVDSTGMRPRVGQTTMILPVTFDYSGGRKDSKRDAKIWSVILGVVGLIVGIGIIFNKDRFFLTNLIIGLGVIYIVSFIIRFFLLKEGRIRKEKIIIQDKDFVDDTKNIWGIYNIDEQYPYYCRFRNGKSGVFVRLNKDVILGKYSESEYEHYEAIADAYNIGGSSNIQLCHIDYMDNIGTDERLEECFISLGRVKNTDVKDILTDIYSFQQQQMEERVTTFDAYLFMWTGSDINAWNTIQRILSCFMQANYRSYHILNEDDLRDLTKVVMNLEDFSVIKAMSGAFVTESSMGVIPIKVTHLDGTETIINKTTEQKKEEAELKAKEAQLLKEENKRRKESKRNKGTTYDEDEEIDLFN